METYLLLADSQADEADALYGLSTKQPELLLHGVLHNVFERGHEQVVVRHKLLLGCVGHRGDGRHHLLQDKLGTLLDQLGGGKGKHLRLQNWLETNKLVLLLKVSVKVNLYLLQLGNHDDVKVLHQAVQIRDQQ